MQKQKMLLLLLGAGILIAIAEISTPADGTETVNYIYDAKGRLVLVQHSGTVNNNVATTYAYDAADNRKMSNVTGAP